FDAPPEVGMNGHFNSVVMGLGLPCRLLLRRPEPAAGAFRATRRTHRSDDRRGLSIRPHLRERHPSFFAQCPGYGQSPVPPPRSCSVTCAASSPSPPGFPPFPPPPHSPPA